MEIADVNCSTITIWICFSLPSKCDSFCPCEKSNPSLSESQNKKNNECKIKDKKQWAFRAADIYWLKELNTVLQSYIWISKVYSGYKTPQGKAASYPKIISSSSFIAVDAFTPYRRKMTMVWNHADMAFHGEKWKLSPKTLCWTWKRFIDKKNGKFIAMVWNGCHVIKTRYCV